jgi:hypothetical protein
MKRHPVRRMWIASMAAVLGLVVALTPALAVAAPDVTRPATTTKLVFIHHSTGQAWLQTGWGDLGKTLGANNYFVSDTNYSWGPSNIGDNTDIGDWTKWFRSGSTPAYTAALYANTGINSDYSRSLANPGGENTIVMFKSCFPNSGVGGSPSDSIPAIGSNPLAGHGMSDLTVGNAKGVYLDLLAYFGAHTDKMFVLVVSPPLRSRDTDSSQARNARALANWLVSPSGLLKDYTGNNVFVYDYYNVLTGGHHRVVGGNVEHSLGPANYLRFPTGDSHPSSAGDRIATQEFVPLLNAAYNSWRLGGSAMPTTTLVRSYASLSAPRTKSARLSRKYTYRWHGTLAPKQKCAGTIRLEFQRKVRGKYRSYSSATTTMASGSGYWSLKKRLKRAGSYRVYARHYADGDHYTCDSGCRYFTVR